MDNENVEPNQSQNQNGNGGIISKVINWVKSHIKLVAIAVVIIIALIAAFTLIKGFIGGPEQAVKNYISALSKFDGKKVANATDIKGSIAYSESYSFLHGLDEKKFKEEYDKVEKDDIDESRKSIIDSMDSIDEDQIKKSNFKIKLVDIKDVTESEDCDKLYTVEAKIRITYKDDDGDKQDNTSTMKFYVYKNKVVKADISSLLSIF